jgi:hypothetical protein
VLVALVTVQVVPVVDHWIEGWHVYMAPDGECYLVEPSRTAAWLSLGQLGARVGCDFGVVFREART